MKEYYLGVMLADGRIIEVPYAVAHKTYDSEQWISSELIKKNRRFKKTDFWSRYGNIVIMGIFLVGCLMILVIFGDKFGAAATTVSNSNAVVSDNLVKVATLVRQCAQPSMPPI